MALKELVPGKLWEYENFITDEEVSIILEKLSALDESSWFEEDLPEYDMHHAGRTYETDNLNITELIKNIDKRVASLFKDYEHIVSIGSIVRGTPHILPSGMHRDNEDGQYEGENRNATCMYGVLMYLNDNFEGGEICYPELGIEYKPKPGVLLIHYAGNMHGVNPITSGTRYSMTSFVSGLDTKVVVTKDQ